MPEPVITPTVDAGAPPSAPVTPVEDLNWAELFPTDPGARVPALPASATPPATPPPTQPVAPPPVVTSEFLKTTTGTVYKSADEAIKGIEHKDTLIEQLRQRYIFERGIDPITNQPVQSTPQAPVPYTQDPNRYFKDLVGAVQKNDSTAYLNTQQQLILDTLGPIAPLITSMAKAQAADSVTVELKDFREFSATDNYRKVMDELPDLKQAIALAESDYRFHNRLPELYKIAYWTAQGRRMPELLRAQPPAAPTQPARPTTSPSTLTPPSAPATQPDMSTAEGRKAIIAAAEARGVDRLVW